MVYPKVPRSCQTGPAENTGLWVWPAPSRADRFSVVKLCVKLCNWVIGGESGEALHGEVRVRPEGSNTDIILRMPGQNAFSPAVALRAWSVLRALLLRSRGSALLPPGGLPWFFFSSLVLFYYYQGLCFSSYAAMSCPALQHLVTISSFSKGRWCPG